MISILVFFSTNSKRDFEMEKDHAKLASHQISVLGEFHYFTEIIIMSQRGQLC